MKLQLFQSVKIKRLSLIIALLVIGGSGILARTIASSHLVAMQQERKLEVREDSFPKGVLKIEKVNNLQSPSFPADFEIEVTNISSKPIYFIDFAMRLPTTKRNGKKLAFPMRYGDVELFNKRINARATDVPLLPNKTLILKSIPGTPSFAQIKPDEGFGERIILVSQVVYFGDGTGYENSQEFSVKTTSKGSKKFREKNISKS